MLGDYSEFHRAEAQKGAPFWLMVILVNETHTHTHAPRVNVCLICGPFLSSQCNPAKKESQYRKRNIKQAFDDLFLSHIFEKLGTLTLTAFICRRCNVIKSFLLCCKPA